MHEYLKSNKCKTKVKSKDSAKLNDIAQSRPLGNPKSIYGGYKADTPKNGRDASGHTHGMRRK